MTKQIELSEGARNLARWWIVAIFAAAMAWVEAAVVLYLRTLVHRIDPYQANPLPVIGNLGEAELVREAATLIMLLMVGILAGGSWRHRLGYSAIAFGIWDILYYLFLRVLCGWPRSVLDWDILFLVPLPWWGPVLAPVSIAALMILWGTLATCWDQAQGRVPWEWAAWAVNICGMLIALYVFMTDAAHAARQGEDAVRHVLPKVFNWPLFGLSLLMMAVPVFHLVSCASRLEAIEPASALAPAQDELEGS